MLTVHHYAEEVVYATSALGIATSGLWLVDILLYDDIPSKVGLWLPVGCNWCLVTIVIVLVFWCFLHNFDRQRMDAKLLESKYL